MNTNRFETFYDAMFYNSFESNEYATEDDLIIALKIAQAYDFVKEKPEFLKTIINYVNGTIVECNTAYEGERDTTEKHKKLFPERSLQKCMYASCNNLE